VLGSSVDVGLAPPVGGCRRIRSWSAVDAVLRPRRSPMSGSTEPSFGVPPGSVRLEARVQLPYDN